MGIPPDLHENEDPGIASDPAMLKMGQEQDSKIELQAYKGDKEDDHPPIPNIFSLEQTLRRFAVDPNSNSLVLPPLNKTTRYQVHMIGEALNLESKSQGEDQERFVTLTKTPQTGVNEINEEKIERMLKIGDRSHDPEVNTVKVKKPSMPAMPHLFPRPDLPRVRPHSVSFSAKSRLLAT